MSIFKRFSKKLVGNSTAESYTNMHREIDKVGGQLSFTLIIDQEGWSAQCNEFPIITGGNNKNPTGEEVIQSIKEAIKTAFNVPYQTQEVGQRNLTPIRTVITQQTELQLC